MQRGAGAALVLILMLLAGACAEGGGTPGPIADAPPEPPVSKAGSTGVAADVAAAEMLLDRGDIPAAIAPLESAVENYSAEAGVPRTELEFLLAQARAASNISTAEARLGDMKSAQFETFVETGSLSKVPYFHDPRVDAYFRDVLRSLRPQAREIRRRVREARG